MISPTEFTIFQTCKHECFREYAQRFYYFNCTWQTYYIYCVWPIIKFIYCSTAKLLERQIERERARKVDEVCLEQKCLLNFNSVFQTLSKYTFFYSICLFCLARTSLHRAQTRQWRGKRFARLIVSYLLLQYTSLFLVVFNDTFYLISLQILIACLLDNVWVSYGEVACYWLT